MTDIKLFRTDGSVALELAAEAADLEKTLQTLIEDNLDAFLGVRLLRSEYATGKTHAGRIDTLGLDEDGSPVIIEYKRAVSESVINQGLFYLDWLMDHKAEFELVVQKVLGLSATASIDWHNPRLICIAAEFTKYDEHAVQQIDRNISLIRHRKFGADLLLLELVNATTSSKSASSPATSLAPGTKGPSPEKGVVEMLTVADTAVVEWYDQLRTFLLARIIHSSAGDAVAEM